MVFIMGQLDMVMDVNTSKLDQQRFLISDSNKILREILVLHHPRSQENRTSLTLASNFG